MARGSWIRGAGLVAALSLAAVAVGPRVAHAGDGGGEAVPASRRAVILPTAVLRAVRTGKKAPEDLEALQIAAALDAQLSDAAQDLGLVVDLGHHDGAAPLDDMALAERAQASGNDVIGPTIERRGPSELELRVAFARPGRKVVRIRVERVAPQDAAVRAVVMLRDLVTEGPVGAGPVAIAGAPPRGTLATPARSAGRSMLAVNATLYGGLVGFSTQRAAGSEDPRLLYPLLAVGAGIGLGGSIIVAEEWDVGVGDAWFLSAGAWWPTLAGHLLYEGRFRQYEATSDARWSFGLVGGITGLTLSTLGLTLHGMGEGGAMLAHSGGGLGLVFGGLAELGSKGDVHQTPFTGMGYGAALGWLGASALATQLEVPTGRVLAVDLGAFLGGLGGAALASPLLFKTSPGRERGWVGATAGASLLGAAIALYVTREAPGREPKNSSPLGIHTRVVEAGLPTLGVIGESVIAEQRAPIVGLSWSGALLR